MAAFDGRPELLIFDGDDPGPTMHVLPLSGLASTRVYLDNQFGQQTYQVSQRRELCVPSLTGALPTTTTTTATVTTSSTTTTTVTVTTSSTTTVAPAPVCGNGIIEAGEECDGGACFPIPVFSCYPPGDPAECTCCVQGGVCSFSPTAPKYPCCDRETTCVRIGGLGTCVRGSCTQPFECGGGVLTCVDGSCCAIPGTRCVPLEPELPDPCCSGCDLDTGLCR